MVGEWCIGIPRRSSSHLICYTAPFFTGEWLPMFRIQSESSAKTTAATLPMKQSEIGKSSHPSWTALKIKTLTCHSYPPQNDCYYPYISSRCVARGLTIKPCHQCDKFCLSNCSITSSYYANIVCLGSILDPMGTVFRGATSKLQPDFYLCQFDSPIGLFEQSSKQDDSGGRGKSASYGIDRTSGRIVYWSDEWGVVSLIVLRAYLGIYYRITQKYGYFHLS
jgi:hypothetical protein